jgi:hypothetical protein
VNTASKLHPQFQAGLTLISGLWGLGKSTLAFTAERPSQTAVIDFDLKGEQMARDYGIRFYASPSTVSADPTHYDVKLLAEWFTQQLQALPEGITTLVLDNATWVEAGLGYLVAQNPTQYGVHPANVASGKYGGVNPGITKLWASIVAYLQSEKGVRSILAINHMTPPWANGAPIVNRYVVRGNKVFRQLCVCALILVPADVKRGGQPPVPSALVAKEAMAIRRYDAERDEFVTRRALPHRIPVCDWAHVNRYFEQPADFANPAPGETWSEFELHAYGDWLSEEQVEWVKTVQSYEEGGEEVSPPKMQPDVGAVKQAWIAEATRLKLIAGPQDVAGLQELKRALGATYTNLVPGCDAQVLQTRGLDLIRTWKRERKAA